LAIVLGAGLPDMQTFIDPATAQLQRTVSGIVDPYQLANSISMIDTQTQSVVNELPGPGGPDCMELMAYGKTLLLSSRWARKVTWIDVESRRVLRQTSVGRSAHGIYTLDHAPRR
jgi:hypothetical protein